MLRRYSEDDLQAMTAHYETHGVVKLPGLIEPEWVDRILAAIDSTARLADGPQPPDRDLSFGRGDGRMTIRYMWRDVPVVRDFLLRPELAEPIARIVGTKTLRFWFDLTFMHNGSTTGDAGVGTPWHHDIAAFTFKGEQLPSLWMAMTPADAQRSRLEFISGSHKTVPGFYRTPDNPRPADGSDDGFLDLPDFDALVAAGQEKLLTWDCAPGDAVIIHPYTIHGARGNTASAHGRRVAITTRWLGDDVRFLPTNWAKASQAVGIAKSQLHLGSRAHGDYFPLVWDSTAR
jgi:ectoine hydroxylase-related dioxygenase (phytanoyl-CoA dioxygenase family)